MDDKDLDAGRLVINEDTTGKGTTSVVPIRTPQIDPALAAGARVTSIGRTAFDVAVTERKIFFDPACDLERAVSEVNPC